MIDCHFKPTTSEYIFTDTEFLTEQDIFNWYTRKGLPIIYGFIIEDFIGNEMTIDQIAKAHRLPYDKVSRILSLYYCKPHFEITLLSRV